MLVKKFVQEFKEFALRGNVVDLAVGVVIGGAFTAIVTSIVEDLFTPIIAAITGSVDFSALVVTLGEGANAPQLGVGNLIQAIINFILVALCVFMVVKGFNKVRKNQAEEAPAAPARVCPFCKSEIAEDATRCPHCTSDLTGK